MNILILNWRDPKNPRSGGAEKVTFKYAEYWVKKGHPVIWICNTFPNCQLVETTSGVKFIRVGPDLGFTVAQLLITYPFFLLKAITTAIKIISQKDINLVIDEIHGFPFFTPFYYHRRNVLLVCEVAGEIWDKMYPFPVNILGKLLEKFVYFVYRDIETWAISKNTKRDVYSLNSNSNIKILPLGIDIYPRPIINKFSFPSTIFLGRLVKMKGVEPAILSAKKIVSEFPNYKLYIVGSGSQEYVLLLNDLVVKNDLEKNIIFCGGLSEKEKFKLLAKCHFLIHSSYKEGFGLTVLEAGLVGTPTIARSGSSLDELIKNKYSGLIFKSNEQISKLFIDWGSGRKYRNLCQHAQKNALRYIWPRVLANSDKLIQSFFINE